MTSPRPSTTAALTVVAIVFVVTVVAVVAAFLFAPEDADAAQVIGPLLGTLAPTIAAVALLVQVKDVKDQQVATDAKVDRVADDTYRLTNGLLDAKLRAGFADVAPHLVHPDAEAQVEEDRRVRDAAHVEQEPAGTMAEGDPHRP